MDFGGVWEAGVVELEVKIEGEEFASEASFLIIVFSAVGLLVEARECEGGGNVMNVVSKL